MTVPRTMLAVVNYGSEPGQVELRELPVPRPAASEVLLKIDAVGICGSDVHQWLAEHSWHVNYPCTLGHEFVGTIVGLGADVTGFRLGDQVVSETAAVIDPASPFVREGNYHLDPSRLGFGYGVDGAMAEYVKVPARLLHGVPDGLPAHIAALTEPCCVAYNAVCSTQAVKVGDSVVVLGPGTIGLLCAKMAQLAGASRVLVLGTPQDGARLALAETFGATDVHAGDPRELIASIGDGLGVDVVIDAAGVSATLKTALEAVRPGGRIIKVGWGREPLGFSLDPIVQKAVQLQGSFSHNWPVWNRVLQMLASGQLDPSPLITRRAPLAGWREAFSNIHDGHDLKVVLHPGTEGQVS